MSYRCHSIRPEDICGGEQGEIGDVGQEVDPSYQGHGDHNGQGDVPTKICTCLQNIDKQNIVWYNLSFNITVQIITLSQLGARGRKIMAGRKINLFRHR